jgi:hypothetical protein
MGLNQWTSPRITLSFDGDREAARALERRARCLTGYLAGSMGERQTEKQMTFHDRNGSVIKVRVSQGVFGKQAQVQIFVEPQDQGWCEYTDAAVLMYLKDEVWTPGLIYRCQNCYNERGEPVRARVVCETTTKWDGVSDEPIIDHVQFERHSVIYTDYGCSFIKPALFANYSGIGNSVVFASSRSEVYIIHHGGGSAGISYTVQPEEIYDIGIIAEGMVAGFKAKTFQENASMWLEVICSEGEVSYYPTEEWAAIFGVPYKMRGRRLSLGSGKVTWVGQYFQFPDKALTPSDRYPDDTPCFRVEESDGTVFAGFFMGDLSYENLSGYLTRPHPEYDYFDGLYDYGGYPADINRDGEMHDDDYLFVGGFPHRPSMWQIYP